MSWPTNMNYGCFHGKLIIIRFSKFVRIVISSSNLLHSDWNELGQCIWFQDFPFTSDPSLECRFRNDLVKYMKDCMIGDDDIKFYIENVDFTSANAFIVSSIPG